MGKSSASVGGRNRETNEQLVGTTQVVSRDNDDLPPLIPAIPPAPDPFAPPPLVPMPPLAPMPGMAGIPEAPSPPPTAPAPDPLTPTPVTSAEVNGPASPAVRVAGEIDQQATVELIVETQEQNAKATAELRDRWNELYAHYRMNVVNPAKDDWQSQVYLPEINPATKKASAKLQSILLKSDDYFVLETDDKVRDAKLIEAQSAVIRYHHEQPVQRGEDGRWKQRRGGVMTLFGEQFESGALFGVAIAKQSWCPSERKQLRYHKGMGWQGVGGFSGGQAFDPDGFDLATARSSKLFYASCDPRRCFWDEEGEYFIEERVVSAPGLWTMVDAGLYDGEAVQRALATDWKGDADLASWLQSKGLSEEDSSYRKKVHLFEYWGDILDKTGRCLAKNSRVVLANKQYILNPDAYQNPFWHGNNPYIVSTPIRTLFRGLMGQSMVEGALTSQVAINDIAQMTLDGLLIRLLSPMWVDKERVVNIDALQKLKPLSTLFFSAGLGNGNPIGQVPLGVIPPESFAQIETLRRAIQNSTFLSDVNMGISPKADTTATEVGLKIQETTAMFESIARGWESQLIEPFVDRTRWLAVQFWDDFDDPALSFLSERYGLPLQFMTREERVAFLAQDVQVRSRGISGYVEKVNERGQIVELLKVFGQIPEFMVRMDKGELLHRILSTYQFSDIDKIMIDENKQRLLAQFEWQKTLQMVGAVPAGGGAMGSGGSQAVMQIARQKLQKAGINPDSPKGKALIQKAMNEARQASGGAGGTGQPGGQPQGGKATSGRNAPLRVARK